MMERAPLGSFGIASTESSTGESRCAALVLSTKATRVPEWFGKTATMGDSWRYSETPCK